MYSLACIFQGSHSVRKTWNFKKTFSSQGKVREIGNFGQFMEKSGKFVNLNCLQNVFFFSIGQMFQVFLSMSGSGLSVTTFSVCGKSPFPLEMLRNGPMVRLYSCQTCLQL